DRAARRPRVIAHGDVPAGPTLGAGAESAVVEVEIPGDGRANEEPLDPEHGPDDEVHGVGLLEVRPLVHGAGDLDLDLNDTARRNVQPKPPLERVADVHAIGI